MLSNLKTFVVKSLFAVSEARRKRACFKQLLAIHTAIEEVVKTLPLHGTISDGLLTVEIKPIDKEKLTKSTLPLFDPNDYLKFQIDVVPRTNDGTIKQMVIEDVRQQACKALADSLENALESSIGVLNAKWRWGVKGGIGEHQSWDNVMHDTRLAVGLRSKHYAPDKSSSSLDFWRNVEQKNNVIIYLLTILEKTDGKEFLQALKDNQFKLSQASADVSQKYDLIEASILEGEHHQDKKKTKHRAL